MGVLKPDGKSRAPHGDEQGRHERGNDNKCCVTHKQTWSRLSIFSRADVQLVLDARPCALHHVVENCAVRRWSLWRAVSVYLSRRAYIRTRHMRGYMTREMDNKAVRGETRKKKDGGIRVICPFQKVPRSALTSSSTK